jgi:predicted metal-dependent HD superfamily phosphohydrolase
VILLDPPAWPAHGTLWSHVVSDSSLHELRTIARAAGLPDRGFDLDHYDAPADRYAELVAAGATAVDGRQLARRLATSGLRVPGHERAGAKRATLAARWSSLWVDSWRVSDPSKPPFAHPQQVGDELVARWGEPHRVYHGRLHLAAALDNLEVLLAATPLDDGEARAARLAVWFHDAVHDGEAGRDEQRSAALAGDLLGPLVDGDVLAADDVAEVARLVLVTAAHDPAPDDTLGELVSDADLAVLGGTPDRYARYVQQVRAEYGSVPDELFRQGRTAVLEQLLALPSLFRSPAGRARWSDRATANLTAELARLR